MINTKKLEKAELQESIWSVNMELDIIERTIQDMENDCINGTLTKSVLYNKLLDNKESHLLELKRLRGFISLIEFNPTNTFTVTCNNCGITTKIEEISSAENPLNVDSKNISIVMDSNHHGKIECAHCKNSISNKSIEELQMTGRA